MISCLEMKHSKIVLPAKFVQVEVKVGKLQCLIYLDKEVIQSKGLETLANLHFEREGILGSVFNPKFTSLVSTTRCRDPKLFQGGDSHYKSDGQEAALWKYFYAMLNAYRLGFQLDCFAFTPWRNVAGGRHYDPDLILPTTSIPGSKFWRFLVAFEPAKV